MGALVGISRTMPETPDTAEKTIRFVCGFLFGLLVGAAVALRATIPDDQACASQVAICISIAVLFGVLAMKKGDRFWQSFRR